MVSESLLERMKRQAAEDGLVFETPHTNKVMTKNVTFDEDLIPEVEFGERPQEWVELDSFVESIDIIDAYQRWCGKMSPKVGKRRESIMISCPDPNHPDKVPSAWINLDKQTWFCGGCQTGGDVFDIAAWHFGYPVPGYKDRTYFPKLREDMAVDYGFQIVRGVGTTLIVQAEEDGTPTVGGNDGGGSLTAGEAMSEDNVADVVPLPNATTYNFFDEPEKIEPIEWHLIAEPDSFLDVWMRCCSISDVPEEYYFWHGLTAIGMAIGLDVQLFDAWPVKGNLFTVLIGGTGDGKSRSITAMDALLRKALPFDRSDPFSTGIELLPMPGSAEALIDSMSRPIYEDDEEGKKRITGYAPSRAYLKVDEFSSMTGRAGRSGSVMKPTLIELYDAPPSISLKSRGAGEVYAEQPYMASVSTTQWNSLSTVMNAGDTMSGFANRWIFVPGRRKPRTSFGGTVINVDPAVPLLQQIRTWSSGLGTRFVRMSNEAMEVYENFYQGTVKPIEDDEELAILARLNLHLKKVMLLLAANERKWEIDAEIAYKAILVAEFLIAAFRKVGDKITTHVDNEIVEAITERVARYQMDRAKAPTARDIHRLMPKRYSSKEITSTVKIMVELGILEEVMDKRVGPGRPTVRLRVAE